MIEKRGCFNCDYQDNTLRDGPCYKCGPSFKCWEPKAEGRPHTPIERALATQVGGGHYKGMPIQPVEFIHKNGIGFCEGAVIKYVSRWRKKNGVEDLKKARHFLDLLIEMEGGAS